MKKFYKDVVSLVTIIVLNLGDLITFETDGIRNLKIFLLKLLGLKINYHCFIDRGFRIIYPRNITIGTNCSLGHYNKIWAFDKVIIGDYVQTAIGLTVIAGGHNTSNYEPLTNQSIKIEGENWIGANVTILGGVTIGRGAIIGAGSVVNKDIAPYSIAVGIPAKVIKKRKSTELVVSPFGYYQPKLTDFEE
ncbi:acyltransferase [Mucilaginibacter kameinonensis]|uniref:acyltransferase n=1 Tax=Mucilaginibacter kameinonensis TaxID=452286 RepID=UPI000EF7CC05|nr:acyltransferase [Mucilaginibacter kameinonensis]